jgi:hypothetical protein
MEVAGSGFALSGADMTLSSTGLVLSASATLPLVGTAKLSGTIQDATHFTLTAPIPSVKVGGFTMTNDTVTLSNTGLVLAGTATLPLVGTAKLSGTVQDATHFTLTAPIPSVKLGAFTLSNDTVTLSPSSLGLKGTATLPVVGSLNLSGTITDSTHFSLGANAIQVGSFLRTDLVIQWDAAANSAILNFNNIAVNPVSFAGNFLDPVVQDLKTATKSLVPLAQFVNAPLPGLSSTSDFGTVLHSGDITVSSLLEAVSTYLGDPTYATYAQEITTFASAVNLISTLPLPSSGGNWINLGSFTALASPTNGSTSFVINGSNPINAAGSHCRTA